MQLAARSVECVLSVLKKSKQKKYLEVVVFGSHSP